MSGVFEVSEEEGGPDVDVSVVVLVVSGFLIAAWDTHGSKLSDMPLK